MATPIVLLIVLGVILGRQIVQMREDSSWVDHTDEVISTANDTLRQIIDQETALRGYILSRDRSYLEPYDRAHPLEGFARLQVLVADNPPQQRRLEEARQRYASWLASFGGLSSADKIDTAIEVAGMRDRRQRMDGVRDVLREAIAVEENLRWQRIKTSTASADMTRSLFVGLIGLSALALAFLSRRQLGAIAETFGSALVAETKAREATEAEAWARAGQAKLVEAMQGERTVEQLGAECLAMLASYVSAEVGAFFTSTGGTWKRRAGFGLDSQTSGAESFADGEGVVGRVASEGGFLHLDEVPADYLKVRSGTGETSPVSLVVLAACVDGSTNAVIELGFLHPVPKRVLDLLGRIGDGVALAVRSSEYKHQLRGLLEESQRQAEELQTQQEELRVANEELESQTNALRATQTQLETQQSELETTNESLQEQQTLLERQNEELAEQQAQIGAKAEEVERASRFKSEFLSNMSHELRTPLNSSLIMAKLLSENRDGNLTAEQVKFADTIHAAGNDLLTLINDILDLSKIEAGKMDVHATVVPIERVTTSLMRTFEQMAKQKGIGFAVRVSPQAPRVLETDGQRLEQILKNLVSNALKFTERGEVVVDVGEHAGRVTFTVRDTGIGIPKEQQAIIFEAFRQADGTTNRRFGGTGLGLSISRELARLLGGDISVSSEQGKGSAFTVAVPPKLVAPGSSPPPPMPAPITAPLSVRAPPPVPKASDSAPPDSGDRLIPEPGKRILLMIEDDEAFADLMTDVAREAGFEPLVAGTAQRGLRLAKRHLPAGIVLDMKLPDHTGLTVLDRLKRDPVTRHIPVHVISSSDATEAALSMGATAYLLKPVDREQIAQAFRALEARSTNRLRRVLVVDDDQTLRESVAKLLGREGVEISTAASARDALTLLREHTFDCVVTDLGMPDQSGYDLLETMASEEPYSVPPVIVYTGRGLTSDEEQRLRRYSRSIIVKGARSPERLLDEVTLFLHQVESELPADQQRLLKAARHREAVFENRSILVVEDDVRNVFALTSVLEPRGARVVIARNGKEALSTLAKEPTIDLVLMDIMMPEMDGLTATREIRKNPAWAKLPIIALTAKAMRDDQEKCMAAGANDYLAKPLDIEVLMSLLRVWMPKT